jgi:hypothetical protein
VFAQNKYPVSIGVWHHVALSTLSHIGYQAPTVIVSLTRWMFQYTWPQVAMLVIVGFIFQTAWLLIPEFSLNYIPCTQAIAMYISSAGIDIDYGKKEYCFVPEDKADSNSK